MIIKNILSSEKDKSAWDSILEKFEACGMNDVFFKHQYVDLYKKPESSVEAYVYEDGGKCFFMPYIKSPVSGNLINGSFYDFETAYGYSGPISTSDDESFLGRAMDDFIDTCRGADIVAGLVRFHPIIENHRFFKTSDKFGVERMNQIVYLALDKNEEDVWNGYEKNTRNKIRKAQKSGVEIVSGSGLEYLLKFKDLYYKTMDQLEAEIFYYFDEAYFKKIYEGLKDGFKVYIAKMGKTEIGAALVLTSRKFIHYHLSSNIKEHRVYEPASLLRHEVITSSLEADRKAIIFGGGRTNASDDSLLRFKGGFSKERAYFYIGKIISNEKVYNSLCKNWEEVNPDKKEKYKRYLLKYKY